MSHPWRQACPGPRGGSVQSEAGCPVIQHPWQGKTNEESQEPPGAHVWRGGGDAAGRSGWGGDFRWLALPCTGCADLMEPSCVIATIWWSGPRQPRLCQHPGRAHPTILRTSTCSLGPSRGTWRRFTSGALRRSPAVSNGAPTSTSRARFENGSISTGTSSLIESIPQPPTMRRIPMTSGMTRCQMPSSASSGAWLRSPAVRNPAPRRRRATRAGSGRPRPLRSACAIFPPAGPPL